MWVISIFHEDVTIAVEVFGTMGGWVVMIDGQSMVEEIIVIIIITFNCTEFTPLGSGIFLGWIGRAYDCKECS
jgi:hypothetical protein